MRLFQATPFQAVAMLMVLGCHTTLATPMPTTPAPVKPPSSAAATAKNIAAFGAAGIAFATMSAVLSHVITGAFNEKRNKDELLARTHQIAMAELESEVLRTAAATRAKEMAAARVGKIAPVATLGDEEDEEDRAFRAHQARHTSMVPVEVTRTQEEADGRMVEEIVPLNVTISTTETIPENMSIAIHETIPLAGPAVLEENVKIGNVVVSSESNATSTSTPPSPSVPTPHQTLRIVQPTENVVLPPHHPRK